MAAEMYHFMKDLYPNQGFYDTGALTQPEPEDQQAMVDDQELAETFIPEDPAANKKIWIALLIVAALIVGLSIAF